TPGKPFFLYFAPGAMHAPHQAPESWIARFRGRYDEGWEAFRARAFARQQELGVIVRGAELPARPEWIPPWNALGGDERGLYARGRGVSPALRAHTAGAVGRLVAFPGGRGLPDDPVLLLTSDTGAGAEGAPLAPRNAPRFTPARVDAPADLIAHAAELGGH